MSFTVTLIPGDGIGPEVVAAAVRVLSATGLTFDWETEPAGLGGDRRARHSPAAPSRRIGAPEQGRPQGSHRDTGRRRAPFGERGDAPAARPLREPAARRNPARRPEPLQRRGPRGGPGEHREPLQRPRARGRAGGRESLKIITEKASLRIARFAFAYARSHGRQRVTAVHKANIMKLSDGLFLDCCRRTAQEYPEVRYDELIVDNCCMQLVLDPTRFDILLLENLYGDIVSDLCAGFIGGLGMAPGANIGETAAIFEAVHGAAPDIAGKNMANPMALILSAAMLLEHLGQDEAGGRVRKAIHEVLREGRVLTRDLGALEGTSQVAEAIAARVWCGCY